MRIHMLAAVAAAMLGAGPALAQDFQFASYSDIQTAYQAQNQEISNLRARLASLEEGAAAPEAAAGHGGCGCGDYGCCNGCGNGCCNGCDSCCNGCFDSCFCSSGCGFVGGVGLYWIKPHWTNNDAFFAAGPGNQTHNYAFDYDFEVAPLAWIGYVGDTGFGVRARWWEFDHSANVVQGGAPAGGIFGGLPPFMVPAAGVTTSFANNLDLDVWDLEATQSVNLGCVTMVGSAGLRYLHIAQRTNILAFGPVSGPTVIAANNFDGVGPTLSLELRRAVGCSGLSLYGNARGSVLFGDQLTDISAFGPGVGAGFQNLTSQWSSVAISELELGAEYSTMVNCSTMAFARAGLVGQYWHGVGNYAGNGTDLAFYGLRTEVGINY